MKHQNYIDLNTKLDRLQEVIDGYSGLGNMGGISWQKAFQERPELPGELGVNPAKDMGRLGAFVRYKIQQGTLKQALSPVAARAKNRNGNQREPAPVATLASPPKVRQPRPEQAACDTLKYCPYCGKNVVVVQKAIQMQAALEATGVKI